jgi:hypothetical protein
VLGDPRAFSGYALPDGGAKLIALPDDLGGNPFLLLYKGPSDEVLYGWGEVANRDVNGYAQARTVFHQIEAEASQALGLDVDGMHFLRVDPGPTLNLYTLNAAQWQQLGDYEQAIGAGPRVVPPSASNGYRQQLIPAAPGTGLYSTNHPIDQDAAASVNRIYAVPFTVRAPGVPAFTLYATVNPWLRIGYITGFAGEVNGGDTWIPQAIETLIDVVKLIAGAISFNVAAVVAAVVDAVQTWYNYAQSLQAAQNAANAKGNLVGGRRSSGPPPLVAAASGRALYQSLLHPPPGGGASSSRGSGLVLAAIVLVAWLALGKGAA